jgi:hypothetical protein
MPQLKMGSTEEPTEKLRVLKSTTRGDTEEKGGEEGKGAMPQREQ